MWVGGESGDVTGPYKANIEVHTQVRVYVKEPHGSYGTEIRSFQTRSRRAGSVVNGNTRKAT